MEIPPKRNFDMTWYRGSVLTPSERARRLVRLFPPDGDAVSIEAIATTAGTSVEAVASLIAIMVRDDLVQPPTEEDATALRDPKKRGQVQLILGSRGRELARSEP